VSHAVKSDLVEQGIKPGKIVVVQNGIDPNLIKEKKDNNDKESENKDNVIVGTITRLSPQKDLKTFLRMATLVIKEIPNVEFIVIGDGEQREELQTLAERLGLHNHVQFLGYREDARDVLKSFDIFVLSSLWEGLPIVVLEAMAAGKPVVATAVDGVTEVVEHGKTGLLVEPGRPDLLAKLVIELINNPDRSKTMGKRGRERIKRAFSINRVINTMEQIYFSQIFNKSPNIYEWLKIYLKKIYSTLVYFEHQLFYKNEEGVLVLFYHSLDHGKPLANFLKHIDYLRKHGYQIISINEVMAYAKGEKSLPSRCVCLTFDDGYYNNYDSVFPILRKYRLPAAVFLSTKYMLGGN
jgi:hypothetical protein